ncbi:MAG: hypothetical protein Tsb005_16510 [Gammaproteobacteria bacterium]
MAFKAYRDPELPIYYWRTKSGREVDFILGEMEIAIEIKSSKRVHETDTKALQILQQEHKVKRCYLVSFEAHAKTLASNILCLPWQMFLEKLWAGDL